MIITAHIHQIIVTIIDQKENNITIKEGNHDQIKRIDIIEKIEEIDHQIQRIKMTKVDHGQTDNIDIKEVNHGHLKTRNNQNIH